MLRRTPDYEEFSTLLERMVEEVPADLLRGVDGVFASPDRMPDPNLSDVYLLGEYHEREDGSYVYLYYGSFVAMGWRSRRKFIREMRDTLLHELRHHWEDAAGLPDLRHEDDHQLERYRERGGARRRKPRSGRFRAVALELAPPVLFLAALVAIIGLLALLIH